MQIKRGVLSSEEEEFYKKHGENERQMWQGQETRRTYVNKIAQGCTSKFWRTDDKGERIVPRL